MNWTRRRKTLATVGTALFLAAVCVLWAGAGRDGTIVVAAKTAAQDGAVASARALGDAFASVAERVKPCVVSVHSEKTVKMKQFQWQMPFGEDFPFKWFFEQGDPGQQQRRLPREYKFHQGGLGSG